MDNTSINAVVHAGPGGTFTASFTVYLNLVSMGSSPNQRLIFSDDQVFELERQLDLRDDRILGRVPGQLIGDR